MALYLLHCLKQMKYEEVLELKLIAHYLNYRKPFFYGLHMTFVLHHGFPHLESSIIAYKPIVAPIVSYMSIFWHTTTLCFALQNLFL